MSLSSDVLSETAKEIPRLKVIACLRANAESTYVSSVSLGELAHGIERLPRGQKRRELEVWLQATTQSLKGRILPFNTRVALESGRLVAELEARGHPMPVVDSQLAGVFANHEI